MLKKLLGLTYPHPLLHYRTGRPASVSGAHVSTMELIVTLLGAGAIAWVNYYFFWAGRAGNGKQ